MRFDITRTEQHGKLHIVAVQIICYSQTHGHDHEIMSVIITANEKDPIQRVMFKTSLFFSDGGGFTQSDWESFLGHMAEAFDQFKKYFGKTCEKWSASV